MRRLVYPKGVCKTEERRKMGRKGGKDGSLKGGVAGGRQGDMWDELFGREREGRKEKLS